MVHGIITGGIDSREWAYAQYGMKTYVWIPRLIYNTQIGNSEIKFLKGNTKIPTDGEDVLSSVTSTWELPDEFTYGNNELTGIWVEITEASNMRDQFEFKKIFTEANWFQGRDIKIVK